MGSFVRIRVTGVQDNIVSGILGLSHPSLVVPSTLPCTINLIINPKIPEMTKKSIK